MSTREFQIEMLWDCPSGHKQQLGRHTKCSECGRPKTEADEYYMPDEGAEALEVTDSEMLADAVAGPNWSCKYCGCHERRNDDECANCGVPQKDGDSEVWERDQKERFEKINPLSDPEPDLSTHSKPRWTQIAKFVGAALVSAVVLGAIIWTCTPHPEAARVQDVYWERVVRIDKQVVVSESGWSPPGDAFDVTNEGSRFHHTDHRVVGHHTEYSSERYSCGQDCRTIPRICRDVPKTCSTTPRSCRKSNCTSNKNGYATCSETCTGGNTICTGGMIVVASHLGCRAWDGEFEARIGPNGDCSHMKNMLRDEDAIPLFGGHAYRLNESCVHEPLPLPQRTKRQFVRLSLPSDAPWYEGYTRNPLGIEPTGPIHAARTEFMAYRP